MAGVAGGWTLSDGKLPPPLEFLGELSNPHCARGGNWSSRLARLQADATARCCPPLLQRAVAGLPKLQKLQLYLLGKIDVGALAALPAVHVPYTAPVAACILSGTLRIAVCVTSCCGVAVPSRRVTSGRCRLAVAAWQLTVGCDCGDGDGSDARDGVAAQFLQLEA